MEVYENFKKRKREQENRGSGSITEPFLFYMEDRDEYFRQKEHSKFDYQFIIFKRLYRLSTKYFWYSFKEKSEDSRCIINCDG